ncbi:MAG: PLP-dependent cysteine synthase family protein [Planctomycetes bacterium]|nr:PLP-dependent cysteine synthase family protein [Planctomycetota bacterium]MCW8136735.1 PLP-dependent cysteine synthase family protein [Planctomycetota bacterium]
MTTTLNSIEDLKRRVPALQLIGNTPLIDVNVYENLFPRLSIQAKAEWVNPGGSIKDRAVLNMLAGIDPDVLGSRRVLDSTSGNSGIAYAMIGAALGIPVTLVIPGNASQERLRRIKAHGAEVILTDPLLGYDEAMRRAHQLAHENPDRYLLVDQYSNAANWQAHYHGTGAEIAKKGSGHFFDGYGKRAQGRVVPFTHFISGVGTGGTLTGIGLRLKDEWPDLKVVLVQPEEFPGIEGLKPLKAPGSIKPKNFHESLVDLRIDVTVDEAFEASRLLARNGLFVGQSSGANLAAARKLAQREPEARIVTVFADTGERYYSTGLWD